MAKRNLTVREYADNFLDMYFDKHARKVLGDTRLQAEYKAILKIAEQRGQTKELADFLELNNVNVKDFMPKPRPSPKFLH